MTSYAVVLKAFAWDPFVERQAARSRDATGAGDFFVSLDETTASFGTLPIDNLFRFSRSSLEALGLASRFEEGSLLWWNPDYTHYAFNRSYPDYDYYVFVEYDAVIAGSYETLVQQAAAHDADLVVLPIKQPLAQWRWTLLHRQTYGARELRGSLVCISVFSRRALEVLGRRRREMSQSGSRVPFWPSAEVFVPTEAARAGLTTLSLSNFGDVALYDAFPPVPEYRLPPLDGLNGLGFIHPVLDDDRYVASMLRSTRFVDFVRGKALRRSLALAASPPSSLQVARAGASRLRDAFDVRRRHAAVRLFAKLADERSFDPAAPSPLDNGDARP